MNTKRKKARKSKSTGGFVYLLTNAAMPGLVKIGMTRRHPLERVRELNSSTALPLPFKIVSAVETKNAVALEKSIHTTLSKQRENGRREFFRISVPEAEKAMSAASRQQNATSVRFSKPAFRKRKIHKRRRSGTTPMELMLTIAFVVFGIVLFEFLNPGTFQFVRDIINRISPPNQWI